MSFFSVHLLQSNNSDIIRVIGAFDLSRAKLKTKSITKICPQITYNLFSLTPITHHLIAQSHFDRSFIPLSLQAQSETQRKAANEFEFLYFQELSRLNPR